LNEIQEAYDEIYGEKDVNWNNIGKWKLEELREAYSNIFENNEENQEYWLKTQIENLLKELEETKIKKIDDFLVKINWKFEENDWWERIKVENWLFDTINEKIKDHDKLYKEYEWKLEGASTALELAWIFENKVKKYFYAWIWWSVLFIVLICVLSYFIYGAIEDVSLEYKNVYLHLLLNLPLFIFTVWGLIFIWNRRAEAKKLEESYKHKEVMARAYVWYKESIKELDSEDNHLLEDHMKNLLETMKFDSSNFLSTKWENHPFLDFINWFSKTDVEKMKSLINDFDISINKK
jgi:hypothetical protein